ncbi:MAG TPA: SprT family zinc-dependent metalloprotease [Anaerolineales bacterium]|jgi:hypothetical protein
MNSLPRRLFDILARMPASVDEIIRSKRKTVSIQVYPDGRVVVRAPLRTPLKLINAFVQSKSGWIDEKKALVSSRPVTPARQFTNGEKFWLLGKQVPLRVMPSQRAALVFEDEFLLAEKALSKALPLFERWYKVRAGAVLSERVKFYAEKHGFQYKKLRISSARTRWGSCSSLGTLSFTWRLVMAPLEVVDYVVIHELAHLKVKNHSAQFWNEVARLMPAYKAAREWLKKNGRFLTLDGTG